MIDSDFDEPEEDGSGADGGAAAERAARRPASRRKAGKYVDPALKRRSTGGAAGARPAKRAKLAAAAPPPVAVDRSSLRKSTKAASARADAQRDKADAVREVRRARMREREREKSPEKVLTQEEMLAEAAETAKANEKDLQRLLRLEEERKRLPAAEVKADVPRMATRDRDGKTLVSFTEAEADARAAMFPQCQPVENGGGGEGGGDPGTAPVRKDTATAGNEG